MWVGSCSSNKLDQKKMNDEILPSRVKMCKYNLIWFWPSHTPAHSGGKMEKQFDKGVYGWLYDRLKN